MDKESKYFNDYLDTTYPTKKATRKHTRKAFEKWLKARYSGDSEYSNHCLIRWSERVKAANQTGCFPEESKRMMEQTNNGYWDSITQMMWECWQEASK